MSAATSAAAPEVRAIASPDARAADVGMWLFLASLVMFYGALFSGYVLLRAGSETWATPWTDAGRDADPWITAGLPFIWLSGAAVALRRWRAAYATLVGAHSRRWGLLLVITFAATARWFTAALSMTRTGHGPATGVAAASWFVLTGFVFVGVVGGGMVAGGMMWRHRFAAPPVHHLRLFERYWWLLFAFWATIVVGMYVL